MRVLFCIAFTIPLLAATEPRLTLRSVSIAPDTFSFKARDFKGEPIDQSRARLMAEEYRRRLQSEGYQHPEVTPDLQVVAPSQADLILRVKAGKRVRIFQVNIDNDDGTGRRALQHLKTSKLRRPAYSQDAIQADIHRIRSAYIARGYVDAVVRHKHTRIEENKAAIQLAVDAGKRFEVQDELCRCLHEERKQAAKAGVLDFSARASVGSQGVFTATSQPGRAYVTGRIEFSGHRKFSDATIRRNLLLNESEPLNLDLLRRSLDRLNTSAMFEPLDESSVDIATDNNTGRADIRIHLRERKSGSWLLSGPVGPVSLAGPARFTLASRLPSWGRSLLDLSSYYASLHLAPGQAVIALQRPFVPAQSWASGFAIAPQLGWKNMAAQYAGTQFRERVLPAAKLRPPAIPVVVERAGGETVMICEPPSPRWPWLKRGATMALQFGSMLAL